MLKGRFNAVLDGLLRKGDGLDDGLMEDFGVGGIVGGGVGEDDGFARDFVAASRVDSDVLSDDEVFEMWAGIEAANKGGMRKVTGRLLRAVWISGVAAVFAFGFLAVRVVGDRADGFSPLFASKLGALDAGADVCLYVDGERCLSFGGSEVRIEYMNGGISVGGNEVMLDREMDGALCHQLVVPKGKRSRVTMEDGTVMWVNAGSRVAFPGRFEKRKRELYVDGRAYLEVSPDKKRPFSVRTTQLNVEVLGTSFDVNAYDDGDGQRVVLVDGSVRVNRAGDENMEAVLGPNEMYSFSNGIARVSGVDAGRLTSWKDGLLLYSSETLGRIASDLSHYYGRTIVCSPEASPVRFTGKLDLKESLELVLIGLAQSSTVSCRSVDGGWAITNS